MPHDPTIPLTGMYPKEMKAGAQTWLYTMFTAVLLTTAKRWKRPKYSSMDKEVNKMWYTHTMEYYSALKRKGILTHITNMDKS